MARPRPQRRTRPRRTWESYAAPVAFLVAVTVAVLLVRSALRNPAPAPAPTAATTRAAATTTAAKKQRKQPATSTAAAKVYVVQAGDSFGTIAAKTGTSVAEIERLNPGVASTSLHIGQKIRVG